MWAGSGRYAIVGVGQTVFTMDHQRSELSLALEAVLAAIEDAGLEAGEVDGLVTDRPDRADPMTMARALGRTDLDLFLAPDLPGPGAAGRAWRPAARSMPPPTPLADC